jgi:hypothetical protein
MGFEVFAAETTADSTESDLRQLVHKLKNDLSGEHPI